jgi:hypothetical protein
MAKTVKAPKMPKMPGEMPMREMPKGHPLPGMPMKGKKPKK